jgi:hypothetical protein
LKISVSIGDVDDPAGDVEFRTLDGAIETVGHEQDRRFRVKKLRLRCSGRTEIDNRPALHRLH